LIVADADGGFPGNIFVPTDRLGPVMADLRRVPGDLEATRLIATAALRQHGAARAIDYLKPLDLVEKSMPDAKTLALHCPRKQLLRCPKQSSMRVLVTDRPHVICHRGEIGS
jgi:hypothetical protein